MTSFGRTVGWGDGRSVGPKSSRDQSRPAASSPLFAPDKRLIVLPCSLVRLLWLLLLLISSFLLSVSVLPLGRLFSIWDFGWVRERATAGPKWGDVVELPTRTTRYRSLVCTFVAQKTPRGSTNGRLNDPTGAQKHSRSRIPTRRILVLVLLFSLGSLL